MTTIDQLDDKELLELSRRTDPLGVLSLYVNADPTGSPEAAAIDINNRYRELQRRIGEDRTSERSREVSAALERLKPELELLTRPATPGRGRIAFAALSGDWILRLDGQMPVPNRVVLDDGPFVHPLLELLDEGRPAGVILVSGQDARLLEWRLGKLRLVSLLEQEEAEASHERAGQIGGGPTGQFHTPMLEQRQARQQERAQRFLDRVAETATDMMDERRWERILVSGGDRWTQPVAAKLPEALQDRVIQDLRVLTGMDDEGLRSAVTERLHEDHALRERRLVEQVREAALARTGALGLSEVAAALNEGRVAHLVYDPEVRYSGSVGTDGALYAGAEVGTDGGPGTPEPRLTERLVERAFSTGARVSPIEGAATGALSEAVGIGALLRW
ncbi:VLRF1 family aeRF1-type release factor [Sphaerimonospora mesophila]|uniref:MSMEG_1130 family ribosome hibernation factor n=1 Tax=Sphaerimonospora mesophila TaxID=37483 RepID=UPI0006E37483